jgi:DNA-binding response OmpR family regulator
MSDGSRVVVASEDEARRHAIASALQRDGHRVSEARAALELCKLAGVTGPSLRHPSRPDAVVLDVTGASWATLDMLEIVCGEHWTLPVIALVAPGDAHARDEARRLGATAAIELPVDEAVVRAEVMGVVAPTTSRGAA